MNKRTEIFLHCAVWLYLFLSPISFIRTNIEGWELRFLCMSMAPLLTLVVFYTNYCCLYRIYMSHERRRKYLFVSITLVVVCVIALHLWNSQTTNIVHPDGPPPDTSPHITRFILFLLHDGFNLIIATIIAVALRLGQYWQKESQARREAESARTQAELSNLRSQINPHFLLNTLNNIYALIAFSPDKAQAAIMELSRLLRHILYDNQQPMVKLGDEVAFLTNYVSLMKIRLSDNVKVEMHTESAANSSQPIVPLLFISLLENAFKHGVSTTLPSFIKISIMSTASSVTCDIRNSYYPKNEDDRSGHGIGLEQVQRRLELAYPGRYTWEKGVSPDGKEYKSEIIIQL